MHLSIFMHTEKLLRKGGNSTTKDWPCISGEIRKSCPELGCSGNKEGHTVQLDSVNYKATEDTEPMNVCKTFGQPECQRRGNKMEKSGCLHPGEPDRNELRRYKCNL